MSSLEIKKLIRGIDKSLNRIQEINESSSMLQDRDDCPFGEEDEERDKYGRGKKNKFFNYAYEDWKGHMWKWKRWGRKNHPSESKDKEIVAFYRGFRYGVSGQKALIEEIKRLESKINFLEKECEKVEIYDAYVKAIKAVKVPKGW